MSEPDWKTELRQQVSETLGWTLGSEEPVTQITDLALGHIEAAYQRGLMAGKSQQGYATRRKARKEDG